MHTWIYKGSLKENTYLYITEANNFEKVPDSLLKLLGDLSFVVDIKLDNKRKLAQADVTHVLEQLESAGYFLQLPPGEMKTAKLC